MQIEYFKPIFLTKKKTDNSKGDQIGGEVTGDEHLGDSRKRYLCLKCN